MEEYISDLRNKIVQDIQKIEEQECCDLQRSGLIIPLLEKAFDELKTFISGYKFKDDYEEIRFFKEIKPQLFSQLVYHNKVYNIEIRMPAGSINDQKNYFETIFS